MRPNLIRTARLIVALSLSQIALSSPARAISPIYADMSVVTLFFASGTSQCFLYAYDRNGNRQGRSNLAYVTRGFWGSSTYGCYNWSL